MLELHRLTPFVLAALTLTASAGCYRQTVLEGDELKLVRRSAPISEAVTLRDDAGMPRVSPGAHLQFQREDGTCTDVLYAQDVHFNDVGVFYDNKNIDQTNISHAYVDGLTPEDHARLLERAPEGCLIRTESAEAELVLVCPERMREWLSDETVITPEEGDPYTAWIAQKFTGEWVFEIEGLKMTPRRGDALSMNHYSYDRVVYESMAWSDVRRVRVFNHDSLRSAAATLLLPLGMALLAANEAGAHAEVEAPDELAWRCEEEPFEDNGSPLRLQKSGQVFIPDEGSTTLFEQADEDAFHARFFASFDFGLNPVAQDSLVGAATVGVRTQNFLDFEAGLRHTLAAGLGEPANSYTNFIVRAGANFNLDPGRTLALFLGWEGGLGTSPLNAIRWGARWTPVEDVTVGLYPFNPTSVLRLDQDFEIIKGDWRTLWVSSVGVVWAF